MIYDVNESPSDDWVETLFIWADAHERPHLEWFEDEFDIEFGGFWHEFPRDKATLLSMTELNFDWYDFTELPDELGNLKQLTSLSFCKKPDGLQARPSPKTDNVLTSIPNSRMGNLVAMGRADQPPSPIIVLSVKYSPTNKLACLKNSITTAE